MIHVQELDKGKNTMWWKHGATVGLLVVLVGVSFIGIATPTSNAKGNKDEEAATIIQSLLLNQANAWNEGNLDKFMDAYWESEQLTFSGGGKTVRGWKATLDRYRTKYSSRELMGKLTFSNLETSQLAPEVALTLGNWHLEREKPASGNFSLVWKKIGNQWKIVHDHSSSAE